MALVSWASVIVLPPPDSFVKSDAISASVLELIKSRSGAVVHPFSALCTLAKLSTPLEPRLSIICIASDAAVGGPLGASLPDVPVKLTVAVLDWERDE